MASSTIQRDDAQVISMASTIEHHSNITDIERFNIFRTGRVVIVEMTFTVGTAINETQAVLFSGLPNARNFMRFRIPHGYDSTKSPLTLGIGGDGKIYNQWSNGGISTGQWAGQFSYICA